jgi:hypothetical protein
MRRTSVILKCLCALVFATGAGLTSLFGAAKFVANTRCWTSTGNLPCTGLGASQCGIPNNGNTCVYCNGFGTAFVKTCVDSNVQTDQCPTTGLWKNCGTAFSGTCSANGDGTFTCTQGPQIGSCQPVYQCSLP